MAQHPPPTVYLGLEYDPAPSTEWVGPGYADYAAQYPADPAPFKSLREYYEGPGSRPVSTPAVIAWGIATVALFVVLNRSF